MKKTLIALAVAASAAVSSSAMAWTANGTGGSVNFSGTLNPKDKVAPWEVKVGDAVNDLNAQIQKGQSTVDIVANKSILALGIRTTDNKAFSGRQGIAPQIDFNNAIDLNSFLSGVTTLTLTVKDGTSNDEIGTLTAPFNAAAVTSITGVPDLGDLYTFMLASGRSGFAGGLSTDWANVNHNPQTVLNALSTDIMANFDTQEQPFTEGGIASSFEQTGGKYSAAYGAGILANDVITINLGQPVTGDAEIVWKAELPVTVSYQ
ncbi:TPA: hypothetical protein ACTW34_004227 [Raoultella planticola]